MTKRYTESFKIHAAEKVLGRANGTTIKEAADRLGVGLSSIGRWIRESNQQKLKEFKAEINHLTKEVNRKDKALAETAALS